MAKDMGIDPTQVTKDLSYTGIVGKPRVGYNIKLLIEVLESFLEFNTLKSAYVFGAGSLGTALMLDHGLRQYGLQINAAFDVSDDKIGLNIGGVNIYHIDNFTKVHTPDVKIGILTVPAPVAQQTAQVMIEGGIKAIWNFTAVQIKTPPEIVVQNTSLYAHLAVIYNRTDL